MIRKILEFLTIVSVIVQIFIFIIFFLIAEGILEYVFKVPAHGIEAVRSLEWQAICIAFWSIITLHLMFWIPILFRIFLFLF